MRTSELIHLIISIVIIVLLCVILVKLPNTKIELNDTQLEKIIASLKPNTQPEQPAKTPTAQNEHWGYTIVSGDSLTGFVKKCNNSDGVEKEIKDLNPTVKNWDKIGAGTKINLPIRCH